MSALFNFQSLLLVLLLLICTCTYVRGTAPGLVDRNREGYSSSMIGGLFGQIRGEPITMCLGRSMKDHRRRSVIDKTGRQEDLGQLESVLEHRAGPEACIVHIDARFLGLFFKFARVGERLSPYVSLACIAMAVTIMIGT